MYRSNLITVFPTNNPSNPPYARNTYTLPNNHPANENTQQKEIKVHQKVKVRVISIDTNRKRINLSMRGI